VENVASHRNLVRFVKSLGRTAAFIPLLLLPIEWVIDRPWYDPLLIPVFLLAHPFLVLVFSVVLANTLGSTRLLRSMLALLVVNLVLLALYWLEK